jgi:hypothetical protein
MPKYSASWIFYDSLSKTQSNAMSTEEAQMAIFKMRLQDTTRFFIWTVGWEKWQPLKAYLESKQAYFVSAFNRHTEENDISNQDTVKALARDVLEMKPSSRETVDEITKTSSGTKSFSGISLTDDDFSKDKEAYESQQFDGDDIKISDIEKPKLNFKKLNQSDTLDNRADRHELKIEILLISAKGKTFRSKSKNISLSGALVEDSIPFDYCGISFDIVVINKQPCDPKYQRVSLRAKTVGEGLTQRIFYVDMTDKQKMSLHKLLENYLEIQNKLAQSG